MDNNIRPLEHGVFEIPLMLSPKLEHKRELLSSWIINAQKELKAFACIFGWEGLMDKPFAKSAEIYDKKSDYDFRLKELCNVEQSVQLPKEYSAALEEEIFISVSPELYRKNYPDGIEDDSFQKLITHEMAHRLHVRILKGDEDAMGPIWFFEGFALFAAGQFISDPIDMKSNDMISIITSKERGSYRLYAKLFRNLLKTMSLTELVSQAGRPEFNARVIKITTRI
ncbi:hypothetical protein KAI78_03510 [bacterium]|nr:hypothetical protein [bacterium]